MIILHALKMKKRAKVKDLWPLIVTAAVPLGNHDLTFLSLLTVNC